VDTAPYTSPTTCHVWNDNCLTVAFDQRQGSDEKSGSQREESDAKRGAHTEQQCNSKQPRHDSGSSVDHILSRLAPIHTTQPHIILYKAIVGMAGLKARVKSKAYTRKINAVKQTVECES
jgi:hypothetical protein